VTAPTRRRRARPATRPPDLREIPYHRGSHTHLLDRRDAATLAPAELDAVIVPTARPVDCLREAARLARDLGCPMVALCSKSARAGDAAALGRALDTPVVALDVRPDVLPPLRTTKLMATDPRYRLLARDSDLSLKRNLGLLLARVAGWRRVLFLDDDISQADPTQVRAAAGLLSELRAVGLANHGFPDNSVVCHAYREVGGRQETFAGGGAMLIDPQSTDAFFPDIYNEDWFFLYADARERRVGMTGSVFHRPFDPFADPERARQEEFGDCLAEGLFWLLHEERGVEAAGAEFWRSAIANRRKLIRHVLVKVRERGQEWAPSHDRMLASLDAAQRISSFITPSLCVDYVEAWQQDLTQWRRSLNRLRPQPSVEKALVELGLLGSAATFCGSGPPRPAS